MKYIAVFVLVVSMFGFFMPTANGQTSREGCTVTFTSSTTFYVEEDLNTTTISAPAGTYTVFVDNGQWVKLNNNTTQGWITSSEKAFDCDNQNGGGISNQQVQQCTDTREALWVVRDPVSDEPISFHDPRYATLAETVGPTFQKDDPNLTILNGKEVIIWKFSEDEIHQNDWISGDIVFALVQQNQQIVYLPVYDTMDQTYPDLGFVKYTQTGDAVKIDVNIQEYLTNSGYVDLWVILPWGGSNLGSCGTYAAIEDNQTNLEGCVISKPYDKVEIQGDTCILTRLILLSCVINPEASSCQNPQPS